MRCHCDTNDDNGFFWIATVFFLIFFMRTLLGL